MKRRKARATNNGAKNADKRKYKTRNVHKSNFQTTRARRAEQQQLKMERKNEGKESRRRAGAKTSNNYNQKMTQK